MIALLLLGFGIVAIIQIPGLVRKQWWRELNVFLLLWATGLILSILMAAGVKLPEITTIIGDAIAKITGI
jgi:hypothetical protein